MGMMQMMGMMARGMGGGGGDGGGGAPWMDWQSGNWSGCGQGGKGGGDSWDGPAVKKPKVSTGDFMKDALVDKIKRFQRSGEEQKQAWWSFCDASEGKNRDPARHGVDVLQNFTQDYGL